MKCAFATQIPGGYSIISLGCQKYVIQTLPTTCDRTGWPVILQKNAHDRLVKIMHRAEEINGLFADRFRSLWNETISDVKAAKAGVVETPEDEACVVEWLSQLIGCAANVGTLQETGDELGQTQTNFRTAVNNAIEQEYTEVATANGYTPTQQTQRRIMFGNLLATLFNSQAFAGNAELERVLEKVTA